MVRPIFTPISLYSTLSPYDFFSKSSAIEKHSERNSFIALIGCLRGISLVLKPSSATYFQVSCVNIIILKLADAPPAYLTPH